MPRYTFRLPDIGEGIAEAEIVAWHVKVGDRVEEDGRLADMMTDKATVELESPVTGKVLEVAGEVGEVIAIGSPLVVLETEGGAAEGEVESSALESLADQTEDQVSDKSAPIAPISSPVRPELVAGPSFSLEAAPKPKISPLRLVGKASRSGPSSTSSGRTAIENSPRAGGGAKVLASPAVRARAKELGVDLADIRSQADGRIRHADLDTFIAYGPGGGYAPAGVERGDEQVKVVGLRRRIAENMAASKRAIPHFTYVEECDITEFEKLRADLNGGRGEKPKLTLLPLLIGAICRSLPGFPMINARYDDEAGVVTRHGAVHLGVATMTPAGLMVPVIRDAQAMNLWQLAAEILRLSEAARTAKAKPEELSGSTLTITSLGPFGGIASTPVINRPEVAIIAPNRIVERPAFVPDGLGGERVAKRKLMNLSISCDHRVVDGYDAAAFVQALKALLEAPGRILAG